MHSLWYSFVFGVKVVRLVCFLPFLFRLCYSHNAFQNKTNGKGIHNRYSGSEFLAYKKATSKPNINSIIVILIT